MASQHQSLVCATLAASVWLLLVTVASASKWRLSFRPVAMNTWGEGKPPETSKMITLPDGSIMAFGEHDLFILHTDEGKWQKITPLGSVSPSKRERHAMTVIGTDIYLFGGKSQERTAKGQLVSDQYY